MKLTNLFICGIVVFALYTLQKDTQESSQKKVATQTEKKSDGQPFLTIPTPTNLPFNKVVILAPPHCPSELGKRADEIEKYLIHYKVPYLRSSEIQFPKMKGDEYKQMKKS